MSADQTQGEPRSEKYLLDTALQNMPHGLCMYEKDGRIILFNDRYARLMGIPPTDLKGLSLLDIFRLRKASGHLKRRSRGRVQGRGLRRAGGTAQHANNRNRTRPLDSRFATAHAKVGVGFPSSRTSANGAGRKPGSCIWNVTTL